MTDRPRVIGRMEDTDGIPVEVSLNFDGTVRVEIGSFTDDGIASPAAMADFDTQGAEQFARLFNAACLEAERDATGALDG